MSITIALVGNPNCGKTTMFNALTGSNQYVGNWPGVTVEKKEGYLKGNKEIKIVDLPGIYSLSPYTPEEIITRDFLINEQPDVILNIIDASNIERNLYLTTQLMETTIPMVIALNMMDIVTKNGTKIHLAKLSKQLGCRIIETTALKQKGLNELIEAVVSVKQAPAMPTFSSDIERMLHEMKSLLSGAVPEPLLRWYSIKLFERDTRVVKQLSLPESVKVKFEEMTIACEEQFDDDSESIITNERYEYISQLVSQYVKKSMQGNLTTSDKIDQLLTNRWLALPIFALIMWGIYYISITSIGTFATDWINDSFFGEFIQGNVAAFLESIQTADWLIGLIVDGIIGGVGGGVASALGGIADIKNTKALQAEAIDYKQDLFGYQLGNVKALPNSIAKSTAYNIINKIFPIIEFYDCTEEERTIVAKKIAWNGMTVMAIGRIADYIGNNWTCKVNDNISISDKGYIKGQLIRIDINDDYHAVAQIADELNKGVYFK